LRYPERVRRLILDAANLYPEGLEPWLLQSFRDSYTAALQDHSPDAAYAAALLELMLNEPQIDPEELHAITAPTLVMAGDRDIIQWDHTLLIAGNIPNARLAIIPGGHEIAREHPPAFNQAVRAFFEETPLDEGVLL
jgi:pimeloyl-ACP methyl ester carboxylesterase